MVRKYLISFGFIFFISGYTIAQVPFQKQWDQRYGGTGNEELAAFIETADGGFILGGSSNSTIGGDKTQNLQGGFDFWIVKTDIQGLKLWDKRFGGSLDDKLHSIQQTTDGGYILGGSSRSGISGDKTEANRDTSTITGPTSDYWIVKIDSAGNKQWDKRYGGMYEDLLNSVMQTSDGGFILGGISYSVAGGDRTQASRGSADYWIVKTDAAGNKQWDKRFGGSNNDQLYALTQTSDHGYLLGGYSWSQATGDKSQTNNGTSNNCDFWIVKTDSLGNKEWDKRFGGAENDQLYSLQQTVDHGYILAGFSWSSVTGDKTENNQGPVNTSDFWMVKIDSLGVKQWDKDFGGVEREDEFGTVMQTADHGYLLSGTSYSDATGNKSQANSGQEQTWLIKTDSIGSKEWDQTIFTAGHDESGMALETSDGSYVIANHTNSGISGYKTLANRDSSNMTYDFFMARFFSPAMNPVAEFSAPKGVECVDRCVNFVNHSLAGTSYQWIFIGATPSTSQDENPQNICYHAPGQFDVTLIASNNHGSDTVTLHHFISVFPNPPVFSVSQSADTLYALPGFSGYQWFSNSTVIPNASNYFYIPVQAGTYQVIVTDSNGCKSTAGISLLEVGIREPSDFQFEIYPNPVDQELNFSFHAWPGLIKIRIVNLTGEQVYEESLQEDVKQPFTLIRKFPPGIYLAIVSGKDFSMNQRFVAK